MSGTGSVSVIIPCYNAAEFLEETFASIAAQTHPVDEIVLVDDGSKDGSPDVARAAGAAAGIPLRVIEQPNLGVSTARNTAIAAATGELIALLDADDLWHPEKIERQLRYLDQHPEAGAVVTSVYQFAGQVERSRSFIRIDDRMLRESKPEDFLVHTWAHPSSMMVRAPILRATPYPTYTRDSEDMIQAVELRLATMIGAIAEPLTWYRYHDSQATQRPDHIAKSLQTRLDWAAEHHARLGYASPREAITPILHFASDRALDYYWRRDIPRFRRQRDLLLEIWPRDVPVPKLLTRFILPTFVLRLRDRIASRRVPYPAT